MKPYLIIFWLLATACNTTIQEPPFDKGKATSEIEQMLIDYHSEINKEGLLAEFKFLDSSNQFYWVPPGYESALSYDSVRSILIQNAKTLKFVTFEWQSLKVFPLKHDIGSYTGIVHGKMTDTAGLFSEMQIIASGTVIRREDGWKLLNGQSALLNTPKDSI